MKEVIEYGAQEYDKMEQSYLDKITKKDQQFNIHKESQEKDQEFKIQSINEKIFSLQKHCRFDKYNLNEKFELICNRLLEGEIQGLQQTVLKMQVRQEEEIKETIITS